MPRPRITPRGACIGAAIALLYGQPHARADPDLFTPQPAGNVSTAQLQGFTLLDSGFASLMKDLVTNDTTGATNAKNASFFFQQCFGGGFIDDLQAALPANLPYVAASAARHDQVAATPRSFRELTATGTPIPPNYPTTPQPSFFTQGLLLGLRNPTISVHDAAGAAILSDEFGLFHNPDFGLNLGQRVDNLGETFKLKETGATSFHALIVVGDPTDDSYRADVEGVFDTIESQWGSVGSGNPTLDISVLFGNGATSVDGRALPAKWNAKAATIENLNAEVDRLDAKMNPNEQLFVYVGDHGGTNVPVVVRQGGGLPPNVRGSGDFTIADGVLLGYDEDAGNADPVIDFDYSFPGTPQTGQTINFFLNNVPIGSAALQAGNNTAQVPFAEGLLQNNNVLSFEHDGAAPITPGDVWYEGASLALARRISPVRKSPFTLRDRFNQTDLDGSSVEFVLEASGPFGFKSQDYANVPKPGLTRGIGFFVNTPNPNARGQVRKVNGDIEFSLTGAATNDRMNAQLIYLLDEIDPSGANLAHPGGTLIQVKLAELPVGAVQFRAFFRDLNVILASLPLMPSPDGLTYWGVANGNLPAGFDLEQVTLLGIDVTMIAQSDVRVVIDSLSIGAVPEPSIGALIPMSLLALARRRRRPLSV